MGQSSSLDRELAHLIKERGQLASKYAKVTAVQKEHAQEVREEKELFAKEHRELEQLAHIKSAMAQEQVREARKATEADEARVKRMVQEEFTQQEKTAKRKRVQAEEAAFARKRAAEMARHKQEQQDIQAEARAEAKRELVAEGLISREHEKARREAHSERLQHDAHSERLQHERNVQLAKSNAQLEAEARHMAVALQWLPQPKAHPAVGVGGKTGIGDPLAQAGVVESSWGPITSTAATRPDPRDSFAKNPSEGKGYKYVGTPYVLANSEKAVIRKGALFVAVACSNGSRRSMVGHS